MHRRATAVVGILLLAAGCARPAFDAKAEEAKLLKRDAEWAARGGGEGRREDRLVLDRRRARHAAGAAGGGGQGGASRLRRGQSEDPGLPDPLEVGEGRLLAGRQARLHARHERDDRAGARRRAADAAGRGITVWRLDADGQWRCVVDIWNAPPSPADGAQGVIESTSRRDPRGLPRARRALSGDARRGSALPSVSRHPPPLFLGQRVQVVRRPEREPARRPEVPVRDDGGRVRSLGRARRRAAPLHGPSLSGRGDLSAGGPADRDERDRLAGVLPLRVFWDRRGALRPRDPDDHERLCGHRSGRPPRLPAPVLDFLAQRQVRAQRNAPRRLAVRGARGLSRKRFPAGPHGPRDPRGAERSRPLDGRSLRGIHRRLSRGPLPPASGRDHAPRPSSRPSSGPRPASRSSRGSWRSCRAGFARRWRRSPSPSRAAPTPSPFPSGRRARRSTSESTSAGLSSRLSSGWRFFSRSDGSPAGGNKEKSSSPSSSWRRRSRPACGCSSSGRAASSTSTGSSGSPFPRPPSPERSSPRSAAGGACRFWPEPSASSCACT